MKCEDIAGGLQEFCNRRYKLEHVEFNALSTWTLNIFKLIINVSWLPSNIKNLLMRIMACFLRYNGYINFIRYHMFIRYYMSRFIANSSSCTTIALSITLTSCFTGIKKQIIKHCEKRYEKSCKELFWSNEIQVKFLLNNYLKGFLASRLSTYDFSTLYTICIAS